MMIDMMNGSQALVAIPSTAPAAGGCSVSVVDMTSMRIPTEAARIPPRRSVELVRESSRGLKTVEVRIRGQLVPPENVRRSKTEARQTGWKDLRIR